MEGFQKGTAGIFVAALFVSALLVSIPAGDINADTKSLEKGYLYILSSGRDRASIVNTLSLVDADTKTAKELFRLEKGYAETLNRDPGGRFWAGYSSPDGRRENRVQIFKADGTFSKTVRTANNPETGIVFSGRRAFIACTKNGFSGAIDVFDQNTLRRIKTIELSSGIKNTPYYLTAVAADEKRVVIAGMTAGPDKNLNYCIISVIDTGNLSILMQSEALAGVDIWCIIPYKGSFVMLNSAPGKGTEKPSSGLLILGEGNKLIKKPFPPSPLTGSIKGDTLYAYHNPAFNSVSTNPSRMLSACNLKTGKYHSWSLPDRWNCSGIAAADGRILLLNSEAPDKNARGVYSFDIREKRLSFFMSIPGARRMLIEK